MTDGMPRMSEVPGWEPLKVFSENREFSAREARHAKRDESPVAADASRSGKPR